MYAWSTGSANSLVSDQNDGGEKGAGYQLYRILDLSGAADVAVVVWRWYGGVPIGSERWRVIKNVAVQALDAGGWIKRGK
jgi:putative IMPACT (imprinted ancient) family translation regulator